MPVKKPHAVPFQMVIQALLDESKMFPPSYLHRFSDISAGELKQLVEIWSRVNPARRVALLEDLQELADSDTLVSFADFSRFALDDADPVVRAAAIQLLWEDSDPALAKRFLRMAEDDPQPTVRAAAASALGMFVYLGELEEIPETLHQQVVEGLLRVTTGPEPALVRRRALEALGFSGREDVAALIQSGYEKGDLEWLQSALFAMGRSADPRWEQPVMDMLTHEDDNIRSEAIRAAGHLELAAAREPLLQILDSGPEIDEDVYATVIWSLSQIGGEGVREALENAQEETEDEDLQEFIERALENLEFTEGFDVVDMFDFEEGNPDDFLLDDGNPSQTGKSDEEDL